MFLRLSFIAIFTGSVFVTSGKFVNTTNTPKLYFAIVALLVITMIAAFTMSKKVWFGFNRLCVFRCIFLVVVAQAFYGLLQYAGWLSSHHPDFAVTGSFDNPAGFAAVLSLGFPTGLILVLRATKIERFLVALGLIVVIGLVIISGSRAGLLAVVVSSAVFFISQKKIIQKIKQVRYHRHLLVFALIALLTAGILLYLQKKDSASGRFLIWRISTEMIKDRPFAGHGFRAFKAKYMAYQARYFVNNPESSFKLLADNVKHPFNEFIKIAVEFGIIGLTILLLFVFVGIRKIVQSNSSCKPVALSGLVSFLVFASFSYPLTYVPVWLLIGFYILSFSGSFQIKIKNTIPIIVTRIIVIVACILLIDNVKIQIGYELKWKRIATDSLRGKTKGMLAEYNKLYSTAMRKNPFFLYNYGAELNIAEKHSESNKILSECMKRFNDYDLQMIMADNYYKKGKLDRAVKIYEHASDMVPCRFLPLYRIFEIYKEQGQQERALYYAKKIKDKNVKIPSATISYMQNNAILYLSSN